MMNLQESFPDLPACLVADQLSFPFYSNIVCADLKDLLDILSLDGCRIQLRSFPLNAVESAKNILEYYQKRMLHQRCEYLKNLQQMEFFSLQVSVLLLLVLLDH